MFHEFHVFCCLFGIFLNDLNIHNTVHNTYTCLHTHRSCLCMIDKSKLYWFFLLKMLSLQEIMAELAGSGNGWKTPCQAKNVQGGSAPRTQDAMMGKACVLTTSGPLRGMNGWMMDDGWWDYDEIMLSHDLLRLSAMFFFLMTGIAWGMGIFTGHTNGGHWCILRRAGFSVEGCD